MATHLFLASTPFNMLTASMVALSLPKSDKKILALIDQPNTTSQFVLSIIHWLTSPFHHTEITSNQAKGSKKSSIRKQAFANIEKLVNEHHPDNIYTGNDRRIEFQYAMHLSQNETQGIYIDDGTYSYLGRKTHWLKDKLIDNCIKKVTYGSWWKQPETIGSSEWISKSILAFPDSAYSILKQKPIQALPQNLSDPAFSELTSNMLAAFNLQQSDISGLDSLVLLPHDSVFDQSFNTVLKELTNADAKTLAIKHHPRTQNKSLFYTDNTKELPAQIPMEILLPSLNKHCKIYGDISTALLTSKWLRPELNCSALLLEKNSDKNNAVSPEWLKLLNLLDIEIKYVT